MNNNQQPVILGKVGASHGVKGWIKITAYTDSVKGIFDYSPWLLKENGQWREVKVADWRQQGKAVIALLDGVENREQAQLLTHCEIGVLSEKIQQLPEGEFYWKDLIGCEVTNTKGYNMGHVEQLLETGSNDVLHVKANIKDAFGKKERLIPFVPEQFIIEINVQEKKILVDWDPDF